MSRSARALAPLALAGALLAAPSAALAASSRHQAAHGQSATHRKTHFVLAGTVTTTAADDAEGKLRVQVARANRKALRGESIGLDVSQVRRVEREDAPAGLAEVLAGDLVVVQGLQVDGAYVALRIHARAADGDDADD